MTQNESTKDQERPRMVTLSKCPTPGCNNGIRASRELYCETCREKHQQTQPEAQLP